LLKVVSAKHKSKLQSLNGNNDVSIRVKDSQRDDMLSEISLTCIMIFVKLIESSIPGTHCLHPSFTKQYIQIFQLSGIGKLLLSVDIHFWISDCFSGAAICKLAFLSKVCFLHFEYFSTIMKTKRYYYWFSAQKPLIKRKYKCTFLWIQKHIKFWLC
jgi:hypothetical protein